MLELLIPPLRSVAATHLLKLGSPGFDPRSGLSFLFLHTLVSVLSPLAGRTFVKTFSG